MVEHLLRMHLDLHLRLLQLLIHWISWELVNHGLSWLNLLVNYNLRSHLHVILSIDLNNRLLILKPTQVITTTLKLTVKSRLLNYLNNLRVLESDLRLLLLLESVKHKSLLGQLLILNHFLVSNHLCWLHYWLNYRRLPIRVSVGSYLLHNWLLLDG